MTKEVRQEKAKVKEGCACRTGKPAAHLFGWAVRTFPSPLSHWIVASPSGRKCPSDITVSFPDRKLFKIQRSQQGGRALLHAAVSSKTQSPEQPWDQVCGTVWGQWARGCWVLSCPLNGSCPHPWGDGWGMSGTDLRFCQKLGLGLGNGEGSLRLKRHLQKANPGLPDPLPWVCRWKRFRGSWRAKGQRKWERS